MDKEGAWSGKKALEVDGQSTANKYLIATFNACIARREVLRRPV
jgi:hypothetical protein